MQSFVLTIFGPKAGVGKTVLATNVAYSLMQRSRGKVLLVDLDLHDCGDVSILLGVQPQKSMVEMLPHVHKMTPEDVEHFAFQQQKGLFVLPASRQLRHLSLLTPEGMERLFSLFRSQYRYIVVDCGSDFHPLTLKIFEMSSVVLFCTTPEILTLNRSVQTLQDFQSLAFPSDLLQVVINRFDPKGVISETLIRQKLKRPCFALLPEDSDSIQSSIHKGVPVIQSDSRSPYGVVMDELVGALLTRSILKPSGSLALNASGISPQPSSPPVLSESVRQRLYGNIINEAQDRLDDIRMKIHQRLIEVMDFRQMSPDVLLKQDEKALEDLKVRTREIILGIIDKIPGIRSREERQELAKNVLDEALGLGPLEDLLQDSTVSEILVNRYNQIFVEREGKLIQANCRFTSDKQLLGVIERIVAPIGRRIDEKTPMVDARLKDGSRVHAIIPPLALNGPMLTIRKFSQTILGPKHLIQLGAMTEEIADFLRACVQARLNILISGGTGTGKTTLLNILSSYIPSEERIITVEDSAELRLPQEHVGRLEARPSNLQGEGAIPIRELVRNTLRMRPDRIIVGECRGAEALDMLQAMNTGHDGSMTTIHANSPRDCVSRLETLVMFAGMDLPSKAIRDQIVSAIQLIIQLTRLGDGTRKITSISEVTGMEGQTIVLQDIFHFHEKGLDEKGKVIGNFQATGLVPTFSEKFKRKGIRMPKGLLTGEN